LSRRIIIEKDMSLKSTSNQVLALAGVYQACQQVQSIAWRGRYDKEIFNTAVHSLFKLDATDVADVYGSTGNLETGLKLLVQELKPHANRNDMELMRYTANLLTLQKKLMAKPRLQVEIRESMLRTRTQLEHYGTHHPNTWAALSDIYQRCISALTPRMLINGERLHLSNEDHAAKVRVLLLAGIRSSVLWRQCGGSRLIFLFNRRHYFQEACNLLAA
jgi:high frequency lysogenization protein